MQSPDGLRNVAMSGSPEGILAIGDPFGQENSHGVSRMGDKRRVDALFKVLSSDFLLSEQFVTDPAQILNEYVSGKRLKSDDAAAANHLVYAVVSNPKLFAWLEGYARSNAEVPAGDDFIRDFARHCPGRR